MKKLIPICILALMISIHATPGIANYEKYLSKKTSAQNKFHAQKIVRKLTKVNKVKLTFIKNITKNFYYNEYKTIKKEYWRAQIHVIRGNIIAAKHILIKNKKDIDNLMEKIAKNYQERSEKLINASTKSITSYHMKAMDRRNISKNEKLIINQKRIKVTMFHMKKALTFIHHKKYVNAIYQYRNAKKIALVILQDLADSKEKIMIKQRYKLDIADNRNIKHGVYID